MSAKLNKSVKVLCTRWSVGLVSMVVAVAVSWLVVPISLGSAASPPEQPATGPGGRDYRFAMVERTRVGSPPHGAFVFTPATGEAEDEASELGTQPLVIFLHGFAAVDPALYGEWIEHLVRRGAVVVYPDYQQANPLVESQDAYLADTVAGVHVALDYLDWPHGEEVGTKAPVAVVGHSLGGILAVNYAAIAARTGFPTPDVLMVVEPGGCASCGAAVGFGVPLPASASFPKTLSASVIVGSDDIAVGEHDALWVWDLLGDLPADQRAYVRVRSDRHGQPALMADHLLPQTDGRGTLDALDWNALWRLLDLQLGCAGPARHCDSIFGDADLEDVEDMGCWSDGEPIQPLVIEARTGRAADDSSTSLTLPLGAA